MTDPGLQPQQEAAAEQRSVVRNDEGQYSLWWPDRTPPRGWHDVGKAGTEAECLSYIEEVWTDMRPLSLQRWMRDNASGADEDL